MIFLQRLKNLWKLSEYKITDPQALQRTGGLVKSGGEKSKMATIVGMEKKEPEPKEYNGNTD